MFMRQMLYQTYTCHERSIKIKQRLKFEKTFFVVIVLFTLSYIILQNYSMHNITQMNALIPIVSSLSS